MPHEAKVLTGVLRNQGHYVQTAENWREKENLDGSQRGKTTLDREGKKTRITEPLENVVER